MSQTLASGQSLFKSAWRRKKKKEEAKARSADVSHTQAQEFSVVEVETAVNSDHSIAIQDTAATEISPLCSSADDREVPTMAAAENLTTLLLLKGIADQLRFTLVKEFIDLGITIQVIHQLVPDVHSRVARLRDRIACLLLAVVHSLKDTKELDHRLVEDLENLKECLAAIVRRLKSIAAQKPSKACFLSESNEKTINDSEKYFQDTIERFQSLRVEMSQNVSLMQQPNHFHSISDMGDDLQRIRDKVNNIQSILLGLRSSKRTTVRIPQLTSPHFGRQEIVQRIAERLSGSDGARICILGPGGMGKTSTALAVMNHSLTNSTFGEDRYWVPCIQANSIDNFIAILFKHVKAETWTGDRLEDIITTLREGDKRRVILLDNFETLWRGIPDAENILKPILASLDSIPNLSILLTMRSERVPFETWHYEYLGPIEAEASQALYTSIHPDSREYPDQLKQLLNALGHMPYAVILMASTGKRSGASPGKLLEDWRAKGTDMLSERDEGINLSIELSIQSKDVQESGDAMRILQILCMLPGGANQADLNIWAGEWSPEGIETLLDAGLVTRRDPSKKDAMNHYLILPIVQSYMAQQDRIPQEVRMAVLHNCCRFLLRNNATVKGPNDPQFREQLAAIRSQDANLQALLTDTLNDDHFITPTSMLHHDYLDALLAFINYQRWTQPRCDIAERVVSLAQRLNAHRQEAAALLCLGSILQEISRYNDAHQAFNLAHTTFKCVGDDLMATQLQLRQLEVDMCRGARPTEMWDSFEAIQSHWETRASASPILEAHLSFSHGHLVWYTGCEVTAIPILQGAAQKYDELALPFERAVCLLLVARCYAGLKEFSTALWYLDLAIVLHGRMFGKEFASPDLITSLLMRARYLKATERWDDEMETTVTAALEASQELGLTLSTILLYLEQGELCVRKGELCSAHDAYKEVIRKGDGMDGKTSADAVVKAKHNLKYIDCLDPSVRGSGVVNSIPFSPPVRY